MSVLGEQLAHIFGRAVAELRRTGETRPNPSDVECHDVVVVGAGICGVIMLKEALSAGLSCLIIERQDDVGGLWNWVPEWQDIQNRPEDFAVDDVPLDGVKQPDVKRHVQAWVNRHELSPHIELGAEVESVTWNGDHWRIDTNRGLHRSRYLVAATGVQNKPWRPPVDRNRSDVAELHSSELLQPEELADRRVTVVGGGASAWDLLDLALDNGANRVDWIYRTARWFLPTRRAKHRMWPNLRELAVVQSILGSTATLSAFLQGLLERSYARFRLGGIEPNEPFDVRRHMLIPGRSTMIQNLTQIDRHHSEIREITGNRVELENGESYETDMVLWATGYRMDLSYLGLPEFEEIERLDELTPRLGSLVRSKDYPNLFFIGMSLIESTSSTPFFAVVEARSMVSHMVGSCEIPMKTVPHQINHWNLIEFFAGFDRANYPSFWWRLKYAWRALWYAIFQDRSVRP